MKECINCGVEIPDNANYCPYCGSLQNNKIACMSNKDKIVDFLLHKALKIKLQDDYSKYFDNHIDYLEDEWSINFAGLFNLIGGDKTAIAECKETLEILSMYCSIIKSYKTLTDVENLDDESVAFPGFDATNETNHYLYACFFLKTMNMFKEIQEYKKSYDLQSHQSSLPMYRIMLKKWNEVKSCWSVNNMSEYNISAILDLPSTIISHNLLV